MLKRLLPALLLLAPLSFAGLVSGCSAETTDEEEAGSGDDATLSKDELGESGEAVTEAAGGPAVVSNSSAVWEVTNQWADKDTANAKKAGVAWGENSGLTWEEKYTAWYKSFKLIKAEAGGWGANPQTWEFPTPFGKVQKAGVFECADTAMVMRVLFASWYNLPFYLTGFDNGQALYAGHFGFVRKDGSNASGFPTFKSLYKDYTSTWRQGQAFPRDTTLRNRHIGSDDRVPYINDPADAGAGAWYDEVLLNKRVGYFLRLLDGYYGSANLADGANMFHLKPTAAKAGDILVERFQKQGIGHTLPLYIAEATSPTRMRIGVCSGSMPRRQAVCDSPEDSIHWFTNQAMGGPGNGFDGSPFASLGGGLRRYRTPVAVSGRWQNIVPVASRGDWVRDEDLAGIAARTAQFEELLKPSSPAEQRDGAVRVIEGARTRLAGSPASCSGRTAREDGFKALYKVMKDSFSKDKAAVDAEFRKLEDYVFAELEYPKSKTCCWNSTNAAMAEIVMDYAKKEQARADVQKVCKVTVFKNGAGGKPGYDLWKAHAASIGRAADWKEWSEDERCDQRAVAEDLLTDSAKANQCL
jgi:hypothetical protein